MPMDKKDRSAALKREAERLREFATMSQAGHQESARLTSEHVAGLAKVLRPGVERALKEETAAVLAADEWVSEARSVASWLARTAKVDEAASDEAQADEVSTKGVGRLLAALRKLGPTSERERAPEEDLPSLRQTEADLAASLARDLMAGRHVEPDASEVEEHAADLARLLISNWFATLEDAVQERPDEAIELAYRVLPHSVPLNEVTEGCEGFALPVEQVIPALLAYQKQLAKPGNHVKLSPLVSLYHSKGGAWHAFAAANTRVLDALRAKEPQRSSLQGIASRATEAFSPVAMGRALQFHGGLMFDADMLRQLSIQAAAMVQAQKFDRGDLPMVASLHEADRFCVEPVADLVLNDLDAMAYPEHSRGHIIGHAGLADYPATDLSVGDLYMTAMPAAAAVICERWGAEGDPLAPRLESIEDDSQQQLLAASMEVVVKVMEAAERNPDLSSKLRLLMEPGHEPSGFGLLSSPLK